MSNDVKTPQFTTGRLEENKQASKELNTPFSGFLEIKSANKRKNEVGVEGQETEEKKLINLLKN